jgi:saccharopine dehydrogenase-like NADP-dependent oxidoreductase
MTTDGLVVIGSGAIGQAIARRTGVGKLILLADINTDSLTATADLMETSGYNVRTQPVDVSSRESVCAWLIWSRPTSRASPSPAGAAR